MREKPRVFPKNYPTPEGRGWDEREPIQLIPDFLDAVLEHIDRHVCFFFGDYERRADPDRAGPAAQEQDATLERHFDNSITFHDAIFLGDLVFDDLDADHQATPADVANQF